MRFTKMHGAGNDYLFIDARNLDRDWPTLAVAMSDRHRGVGADGIILMLPAARAHTRMRIFNADGSEGEMCGNGIRCLVRFALERGAVPGDASPVLVETLAGIIKVTPVLDGGVVARARVAMGEPRTAAADIPVDLPGLSEVVDYPLVVAGRKLHITCVSMGNPHAVSFHDEPVGEVPLHDIGPAVEHHPMFPKRTNFEIVNVVDASRVRVRVWERGSGLTQACGTGACAVVVATRRRGSVGDAVQVELPGGTLIVRWPGAGPVELEGPVAKVFEAYWPD